MKLKCINVATTNVTELRDFYSLVFQSDYAEVVPGRFEIPAGGVTIVITPSRFKTQVNPDSCGLEFLVDNVDREYERLVAAGIEIPNPPVTYPWKWRAIGFKDPVGNHIDFVQPAGGAESLSFD